ncbi:MAG: class I SAM-dependent methyltransferase [Limnohabitans sp.]
MQLDLPRHGALQALADVPRTLLIPLVARAQGGPLLPTLDPQDRCAAQVLARSGVQVRELGNDMGMVVNILWRTRLIKQVASEFFVQNPQACGINLGAGLAQYFQWLDNGSNHWIDADLPKVMALRRRWIRQRARRCHEQALDITQAGWLSHLHSRLPHPHGPWLVVCEGVLMYLQPTQVRAVLRELAEQAPEGNELLCDFISPLGIGHAGLSSSMASAHAEFHWGAHNGAEIAALHPRLELLAQHSVSEAYGWGASLVEFGCSPWIGGPVYALAHLRVGPP